MYFDAKRLSDYVWNVCGCFEPVRLRARTLRHLIYEISVQTNRTLAIHLMNKSQKISLLSMRIIQFWPIDKLLSNWIANIWFMALWSNLSIWINATKQLIHKMRVYSATIYCCSLYAKTKSISNENDLIHLAWSAIKLLQKVFEVLAESTRTNSVSFTFVLFLSRSFFPLSLWSIVSCALCLESNVLPSFSLQSTYIGKHSTPQHTTAQHLPCNEDTIGLTITISRLWNL